ncbi:MAG: hypothetical protein Greene101449_1312 [Candidatus Peregrinibacteria bacterium Greene1014_49]|nr:MAG: hypothetical protein Greene101449_1312 [Candidatus Peregrinibacteria bacterium Greene1014_49]
MHGKSEFLRDRIAKDFDRATGAHKSAAAKCRYIVAPCFEKLIHLFQTDDFVLDSAWMYETTKLGLAPHKRRLASFESEIPALPCAGLLTFGTTAAGRSTAAGITTRDTLALGNGTPCWSKSMKHLRKLSEMRHRKQPENML